MRVTYNEQVVLAISTKYAIAAPRRYVGLRTVRSTWHGRLSHEHGAIFSRPRREAGTGS
jgi:hypothetical protein